MPHAESKTARLSAGATGPPATGAARGPLREQLAGPSSRQRGTPRTKKRCPHAPAAPSRSGRAGRRPLPGRPEPDGRVRGGGVRCRSVLRLRLGRGRERAPAPCGSWRQGADSRPEVSDLRVPPVQCHRHSESEADVKTPRLQPGGAQVLPALCRGLAGDCEGGIGREQLQSRAVSLSSARGEPARVRRTAPRSASRRRSAGTTPPSASPSLRRTRPRRTEARPERPSLQS